MVLILEQVNLTESTSLHRGNAGSADQTDSICSGPNEEGFAPNTKLVLDALACKSRVVGHKNWKPENYGKKFYGPYQLLRKEVIEYSRNLMTVRIAKSF